MEKRVFKREQLNDLLDDAETVSTAPWRWGTVETMVFEADGAHWMIDVRYHHDEGAEMFDEMTAVKAKKVTKTIESWEPA